jgi:ATP-dependent helicase/nuclease subunit A
MTAPTKPSLTPQQHAAIHSRDVSIALSAGAGCGKTFVLTRRFLSHLEPSEHPCELSSLVAITFTERAAREMRDRIRTECRRRLRSCPDDEVEYWLRIVREVDSARITTIHSFCASLLRSHAVEAGLDPRFALLEETTGGAFLRNAVRQGLHRLLSRSDENALELVYEYGLARTAELLESFVYQRFNGDFSAQLEQSPEQLAAFWEERWKTFALPELLRQISESAAAETVLTLLRENVPDNAVMRARREFILDGLPRLSEAADPAAALDALRDNLKVQGGGGKGAWDDEDVYAAVQEAFKDLRENQIDKLRDQLDVNPEHTLRAAQLGLCALRAGRHVADAYAEEKRSAGLLDFDDLLLGAQRLLREHPEVCDRIARGISLLMVDEFQDTDPVQTEIVRRLCGAALHAGKLFMVGDAKQSIYRFRRAEPRIFHELRREIPEFGRLPLSTNFRSQPEILAFVNAVCDGAIGPEYEPLVPHVSQISPTPAVEFLFATRDAGELEGSPDAVRQETAGERRAREAEWIARRVHSLLTDGVPRIRTKAAAAGETDLRPVQPRDVVILFRAMSDVRYYEEALRRRRLDYYVVGGRAFYAQQEIYDLVNLCKYLDDVDDEVALVGVLRSPFFSLSDDSLYALSWSPQCRDGEGAPAGEHSSVPAGLGTLTAALNGPRPAHLPEVQQEQIGRAARVLGELRAAKDRLSIAALLNLAVERTGYDAALLAEFLGVRKLANLRKLLDMARQFDRAGFLSLADFVDRLEESIADETKEPLAPTHPESSDVIRLMTIHQAKGLEFPVVVVADMDRPEFDPTPRALFDPELGPLLSLPEKFGVERKNLGQRLYRTREVPQSREESLRLLYVALTRAADHLILSAGLKAPERVSGAWLRQVAERFDLLTGQPRLAPGKGGVSPAAKYVSSWPQIRVHHTLPEVPAGEVAAGARRLPLTEFRETVAQTEPAPLPATLAILPADPRARRNFSVSELEQIDELLRARSGPLRKPAEPDGLDHETDDAETESAPVEAADLLGDIIHKALEQYDFSGASDVASLVARCARLETRHVSDSMISAAQKWVTKFAASAAAKELAGASRLYRELEFTLRWPVDGDPGSAALVAGTFDCLFQDAAGAWSLFDYKTGASRTSRDDEWLLDHYGFQLGLYCLAVRQGTGRLPARAELILIVGGKLKRVSFQPTGPALDDISRRLTAAIGHLRMHQGD